MSADIRRDNRRLFVRLAIVAVALGVSSGASIVGLAIIGAVAGALLVPVLKLGVWLTVGILKLAFWAAVILVGLGVLASLFG